MANHYYAEVTLDQDLVPVGFYHIEAIDPNMSIYYSPRVLNALRVADRVWKENEHGIFFIKGNNGKSKIPNNLSDDDIKEFMWVKLRAQDLE